MIFTITSIRICSIELIIIIMSISLDDLSMHLDMCSSGCFSDIEKSNDTMFKKYGRSCFLKAFGDFCCAPKESEPKKYIYMLTISLDPALHPTDSPELVKEIEEQLRTMPQRRKALKIKHLSFVKEKTKANRDHWHVSLETEHAITKNHFKYFTQKYGFIHFSRSKSETQKTALVYMGKSDDIEHVL